MAKGVILSLIASCVFALLYLYSQLLTGLDSYQVFGWRMLMTLPFIWLFAKFSGDIQHITQLYQRIKNEPKIIPLLILTSILGCSQLWLFMWGPVMGRGLQVSLGYFLLPLVMVLIGRVFLKEQLSKLQMFAVICACVGVSHEIWRVGQIAWETCLVAIGYSAYFWLRTKIGTNHLGGFFWDIVIILPVALYFISTSDLGRIVEQVSFLPIMLGFGLLSAIGLGSYLLASRLLSFSLFGLLSYVEPVLLAMASLILGESISGQEWFTYVPIWFAVLILAYEGALNMYKQRKFYKK